MRISAASRRFFGFGRHLARDEGGAVLIYVSIALAVFMGFAALVVDGGRLFTLDTELQSAADALALAGAAELDGAADAQNRAIGAMNALVQNSDTFGNDPAAIVGATEYAARFLSALPADGQPLSAATVAATQPEARFVEVTVNEREVDSMFATAIGGDDTAGAEAIAVAGFTSAVCKFTPLFICNPYEETDPSLAHFTSEMSTQADKRRQIALKRSGQGAGLDPAPGNFGFLDSGGHGASALGEALARVDPGACFRKDHVETKPGSNNSVHGEINVRFDLYGPGTKKSWKSSADYRPAQNVTKGYTGTDCDQVEAEDPAVAMGFPTDNFIDVDDNRVGDGNWDVESYWNLNHPGITYPPAEHTDWGTSDADRPSRYEVYRWEVDPDSNPATTANHIPNNSPGGENGNAQCNDDHVSDEVDRRIIYAAVVNCNAELSSGRTGGEALTFVKMFMTQPMIKGHDPEDDTLFVEMVDIVKPGTADEVVHDIVQLYR